MRFSVLSALALVPAAVFGQTAPASSDYLTQVLGALTAANLTSLASVFGGIANTTSGMAFLAQLAVGNHTVFAPTNAAFAKLPAAQLANRTLGAEIVAYHVLNNTYTPDGIAVAPAHTIARSLLNFGGYALPGNHSAPVVLTRTSNTTNTTSPFEIVQATDNVTVTGPVNAANLQVYIIHEVLAIPESVELTVNAIDMPLAGLLNATTFYYRLDPIRAPAITIFAPEPQAVMAANNLISTLNSTDIYRVLDNHIINGSIVYSTDLTSRNYTSQGGEPFMFSSNATGVFVTSGMTTARIIQSDTVLQNGVVHVIDAVLANPAKNYSAAVAAYKSDMMADATLTDRTGPITATAMPMANATMMP